MGYINLPAGQTLMPFPRRAPEFRRQPATRGAGFAMFATKQTAHGQTCVTRPVSARKDEAMLRTVLLIEDNSPNAARVKKALLGSGDGPFVVERVRKCSEAQEQLCMERKRPITAVVTNLFLPDSQGLQTIARLLEVSPHMPILVLTTADNEDVAKQAIHRGARDYVLQHRLDNYSLPKILQNMLHRVPGAAAALAETAPTPAALNSIDDLAHDYLTGLPNALLLEDRLSQAIAYACRHRQSLAVLCVNIDRFKNVNDALGHEIGNHLLRSIAARLIASVRASDTVSRQHGGEFVVLLPELDNAEDAALSAQKILTSLGVPHRIEKHDLQITATIGIAVYPDDGSDAETLIKNASVAMSNAKEQSHDSYGFFKPHMNEHAIERRFLECGLRHALERQEFVMYYQPQIDLQTEAIVGAEALIRWRRPQRGLALPNEFMPVAEQSGHIVQIGLWALREACRQARSWREADPAPLPVGINISAVELRSTGFVECVRSILSETGMPPQRLELEIKELAFVDNHQSIAAVLRAMVDMGVQVALDHFGAGPSSLTHLKRYPVDALKIDASLVQGLCTSDGNADIVNAVISAAKSFRLRVIAQGIETRDQFLALQSLQCREGQGRYFHEPVPANEFAKLLEHGLHPLEAR
jgi:diguanylate cyclase (GGDEF)-like protein